MRGQFRKWKRGEGGEEEGREKRKDHEEKDLPSIRGATTSIRLAANIWVFILFTEIKAEIVDDITSVFNDIGALRHVSGGGVAADILKLGQVVRMGSGGKAGENVLPGKEESSGADGEEGTLAGRVLLLELGPVVDEPKWLLFLVEDLLGVAADDDENVEFLEALVGFLEGKLGVDDDALLGENLGLSASNGDFEGFGSCLDASAIQADKMDFKREGGGVLVCEGTEKETERERWRKRDNEKAGHSTHLRPWHRVWPRQRSREALQSPES